MSSADYNHLFKLLIIGDSGVGKSSLLVRYTEDTFSGSYITTIGVDFKIKTIEIDGVRVKLQIWDTAGQERFRTITATYYRGAHGIIVVYDVNVPTTFLNVKRWFDEIHQNCPPNVSKMIVGNKDDSPETKLVATQDLQIVARDFGVPFVEASARNNVNVDLLFTTITSEILESKVRLQQQHGDQPHAEGGGIKIKKMSSDASSKQRKCCSSG